MLRTGGKREHLFFIFTFIIFYLLTASVVPYLGVRMNFLSFGGRIVQNAVKPDILFALVLCSAILSGRRRAVILGIVFGFIVDVSCSVPMLSPLCYCLCAMYAGGLSFAFPGKGAVNAMLVSVPLLLMKAVVGTFYLLGTWHSISLGDIILGAVLPEYIYNILSVAVVYGVLSLLMKLFRIEKAL
ncbi:MAG: hypothetical protein IKI97_14115 [Clostridia bacterium]|nr:hypothetical protein [Clostridia bacterium]